MLRLSVSAVVMYQNKIALLHRTENCHTMRNVWSLPGGKVDPEDETLLAAVNRENLEEIGIQPEVVGTLGFQEEHFVQGAEFVNHIFVCKATDAEYEKASNMEPEKAHEFRWVDREEVFGYKLSSIGREILGRLRAPSPYLLFRVDD